jgi:pyruvate,water dikinase
LNISTLKNIETYAKLPSDGVGLFRCEYLILKLKEHPLKLIREEREFEYTYTIEEALGKVAKLFHPRPVVFRTSDLKTNEHRCLEGGEIFETEEENPAIGLRGCSRYLHEKFSKIFELELRAIKNLRERGLDNIWLMIPFVRKVEEIEEIRNIISTLNLFQKSFKLWIMLEVPIMVFQIKKLANLCDGISIGSNDLYSLFFGVDRENEELIDKGYFNENDEEFKKIIKKIINDAHSVGLTVSFCGDAVSKFPELVKFLIEKKVDSISVSPEAFSKVNELKNFF